MTERTETPMSVEEFLLEGEAIGAEAVIELPEIGISLPLSDIYEGLDLKI